MITLQVYTDREEALQAIAFLKDHGIEAGLAQKYENGVQTFRLQLDENDKGRAEALLTSPEDTIELADNYLDGFTDEELLEVLVNQENYHTSVVANARELLLSKRPGLDIEAVEKYHQGQFQEKLATVQAGKTMGFLGLTLAYLSVLVGGVGGIIAGLVLEEGRTLGPDGESYHTYAPEVRKHGRIIRWIGILLLVGIIVYKIMREAL